MYLVGENFKRKDVAGKDVLTLAATLDVGDGWRSGEHERPALRQWHRWW